jgi:tetratricopeptide (TPR) repeat protein
MTNSQDVLALHREAVQAMNRRAFKKAYTCCIRILERDPDFPDAQFLLGMIAAEHGQFAKALPYIDKALASTPENSEYLAQKARCLVFLQRDSDALESATRALNADPDSAAVLDTIGVVLSKTGAHDMAIEAFRRAVKSQPREPQFHFNMAASQQFVGDFSGAERSYEEAINLKPDFYRAHWALTELTTATTQSNHIERLKRLVDSGPPDADANLYLCHALAKEHEQLGEYAKAFEYWQQGKQGKRPSLQFTMAEYEALFGAVSRVCSAEFLQSNQPGFDTEEPIFIVGMPRTGTTLVERILASHEEVFAAGELNDFGLCVKRLVGTTSRKVLDEETIEAASSIDFAELGRAYIDSTRPRTGHTRHFIDKLPPNFFYAGFIARALPSARVICLRRQPLDTCLSNYRQLFSLNAPYYNYAYDILDTGRYYLMFDALVKHWESVLSKNFLVVEYEALTRDFEREARSLLEFCGLSWNPDVLSFHASKAPVATASAVQVRDPIHTRGVQRWRHYEDQLRPLITLFENHGIINDVGTP